MYIETGKVTAEQDSLLDEHENETVLSDGGVDIPEASMVDSMSESSDRQIMDLEGLEFEDGDGGHAMGDYGGEVDKMDEDHLIDFDSAHDQDDQVRL